MAKCRLTGYDRGYIKRCYLRMSDREIGERRGLTECEVRNYRKREGLVKPDHVKVALKLKGMANHYAQVAHPHDDFFRENYLTIPVKRMAAMVGKSGLYAFNRLKVMGLTVPEHLAKHRRMSTCFKEGHVPMNKGMKQVEYMSKAAIEKTKKTRYKKGHKPHNTRHDGAISIRKDTARDGTVRQYQWIRLKEGVWKMLHVHVWEKKYGPLPKDMVVIFKNGDTMNCKLSNLEALTRKEHMKRNSIMRYPEELRQLIRLNQKLKRVINNHGEKNRTKDTELAE